MPVFKTGQPQILTSSWGSEYTEDTDYVKCRLPYNGHYASGTQSTVLFYNSQGYGRMVGRCYITLGISQNHSGYFDFYVSKYGGGIQNQHNTNWCNVQYVSNVGGNGNYHGFAWYNTNSNTWGNGGMAYYVEAWGGGLTSGKYNLSHDAGYTALTSYFADSRDDLPFARRVQ